MSGLSRTPGKRVWVYPHRGFESRPLRQNQVSQRSTKTLVTTQKAPLTRGFLRFGS